MPDKMPWPGRDECLAALREGDGAGVRVAVLDTGVDLENECFAGLRFGGAWEAKADAHGVSVIEVETGDPVGHGTGIAGIIHRIAPDAEIISIRVLDVSSRQMRHQVIQAGAELAIRLGAPILNCSFGVPGTGFAVGSYLSWTDLAVRENRIVVGASSNDSAEAPEWPSHLSAVIGVTAADCGDEEIIWREGRAVEVAAAGLRVEVPLPGDGKNLVSGSSFAAARVSGMLARLISCFPGLSPALAREALRHAGSGERRGPQA